VNSLNTFPEIEAHQCHFLGEDALRKSLTTATDSKLSPYFRKHLVGQLVANLELTYRANCIRDGRDDKALKIIALSREPLDWLRSCIQQDIEGYKDEILAFSQAHAVSDTDASVEDGLTRILQTLADFIMSKGDIQSAIAAFREPDKKLFFKDPALAPFEIVRRMLMLSFRPLLWFEDHYATCFDVHLSDMARENGFWLLTEPTTTHLILRYEDLESCLPRALAAAGLPAPKGLSLSNSSKNKPFAADIRAAFQSAAAQQLRRHLLGSEYARFFGYDAQSAIAAA